MTITSAKEKTKDVSSSKNLPSAKQSKRKVELEDEIEKPAKIQKVDKVTIKFDDLPLGLNDHKFNDFLKSKGLDVLNCRVNYERGVGYVDVKPEQQSIALELNEVEWNDNVLSVTIDERKREKRKKKIKAGELGANNNKNDCTLFCKNLPYDATEEEIAGLFVGVKDVRRLTDKETGRSKGNAFIEFYSEEDKEEAHKLNDKVELEGRKLYLDLCGEMARGGKGRNRGFGRGRGGFGRGRGFRGSRGGFRGGSRGASRGGRGRSRGGHRGSKGGRGAGFKKGRGVAKAGSSK